MKKLLTFAPVSTMAMKLHGLTYKLAIKTSVMNLSVSQILHSESAIFHDEGLKVYDEIHKYIENGEIVELSFHGITTCSTQFMNACIGKVYVEFPKRAEDLLKITDYEQMPLFASKLHDVIDNARNFDEYNLDVTSLLA